MINSLILALVPRIHLLISLLAVAEPLPFVIRGVKNKDQAKEIISDKPIMSSRIIET